jgi:hypothetical protein
VWIETYDYIQDSFSCSRTILINVTGVDNFQVIIDQIRIEAKPEGEREIEDDTRERKEKEKRKREVINSYK